jgi:hypothetical protein
LKKIVFGWRRLLILKGMLGAKTDEGLRAGPGNREGCPDVSISEKKANRREVDDE